MSLIFSGAFGSPEAAFHRATRTAESVAPVVLWIDEMESSLTAPKDVASPQAMTFSAFLTWMQEKPPLVFVAATANHIEKLPAEIIRKGRFDMVFFVDLPNEDERAHIIQIKLQDNGADPKLFDIPKLVLATNERSGAEIQEAISSARIEALEQKRTLSQQDIMHQLLITVPLSKTMAEQFKKIREWAFDRATPASNIWK
jgi:SpoVK/Ycf46/Vps4 family AAA+-type ATPase